MGSNRSESKWIQTWCQLLSAPRIHWLTGWMWPSWRWHLKVQSPKINLWCPLKKVAWIWIQIQIQICTPSLELVSNQNNSRWMRHQKFLIIGDWKEFIHPPRGNHQRSQSLIGESLISDQRGIKSQRKETVPSLIFHESRTSQGIPITWESRGEQAAQGALIATTVVE